MVVVEDDSEVSQDFLKFMFNALERYSDDNDVMQVAGHTIAPPENLTRTPSFAYYYYFGVGAPGIVLGNIFLGP